MITGESNAMMDFTVDMSNIIVPQSPIQADFGQWIIDHPDCDTIYEQPSNAPSIIVFAYAASKQGNYPLHLYRDQMYAGKKILKGVSIDGVRKFI